MFHWSWNHYQSLMSIRKEVLVLNVQLYVGGKWEGNGSIAKGQPLLKWKQIYLQLDGVKVTVLFILIQWAQSMTTTPITWLLCIKNTHNIETEKRKFKIKFNFPKCSILKQIHFKIFSSWKILSKLTLFKKNISVSNKIAFFCNSNITK